MTKVKLKILRINNSQRQAGAYALILAEEKGERKLPIIIGAFEAQSIVLQLEGLRPPRPLTHDLFHSFALQFEIKIIEIFIHRLEQGVFYALLICEKDGEITKIDARTSDAVSLALRFNCPIYTTEEILVSAGIILETEQEKRKQQASIEKQNLEVEWKNLTIKQLEGELEKAIEEEKYEKASEIKNEISSRKQK